MNSDLSIKELIEMIGQIGNKINRASNLLSDHLNKLTSGDNPKNKQHVSRIKREIHTILSQLSRFSVFCSKSTKGEIDKLSKMGAYFTMFQSTRTFYNKRHLIDHWASLVLTIGTAINVTKWPLELEGAFKIKIKDFIEASFKGKTKRPP